MKKKISPIKLHNLSEAEMGTRELNLLRGGSGADPCACASACVGSNCTCGSWGLASTIKAGDAGRIEKLQSDSVTFGNHYVKHPAT